MKILSKAQQVERSIITTYRKSIWAPFVDAVKQYDLISPTDKIAVCISGGKDSMLLAKLMQELSKHGDYPLDLVFLAMDPGYSPLNRDKIISNAELLEIPLTIFDSDIFDVADSLSDNPCYMCARMRRGHLYAKAKELGCNKIALGHHLSDVIETTLMGMLWGGQLQGMMPKLKSTNFEGLELIRPMYCIKEDDIERWRDHNSLDFLACACKFTESLHLEGDVFSARKKVKQLIRDLKVDNENIENSLFSSIHNVQLDTFPSYKQDGVVHNFLDDYND